MKLISSVPKPAPRKQQSFQTNFPNKFSPLADQVRKFSFATYQPKKVYYIFLDFQPQQTVMCNFTALFVNLQYSRLV